MTQKHFPFFRICNAETVNISICNAETVNISICNAEKMRLPCYDSLQPKRL